MGSCSAMNGNSFCPSFFNHLSIFDSINMIFIPPNSNFNSNWYTYGFNDGFCNFVD
ncbi:hypothetical protein EVA_20056 [gut metagenome]|uniref:Uncharacterized protein n=1 Tax=gut metagenome TaxID=749906 RepID=J9FQH5_9ZZZZ